MKIYIVTTGEYSDYQIENVFMSREKAEIFCAIRNSSKDHPEWSDDFYIEEYDTADDTINGDPKLYYIYRFHGADYYNSNVMIKTVKEENRVFANSFGFYTAVVCLEEDNSKKALKIAQDMVAKYKAEREGLV